MVFNHEVAPNYLRTKPTPEVEEKTNHLTNKAQQISQDNTQVFIEHTGSSNMCTLYCQNIIFYCLTLSQIKILDSAKLKGLAEDNFKL